MTPHTTGPTSKSDQGNSKAVAVIESKVNGAGDTPSSSNLPSTTASANTEKPEEKEDVGAYGVFSSTERLVKAKSGSAGAKAWQQNTAVKVSKARLIEDVNSMVEVINKVRLFVMKEIMAFTIQCNAYNFFGVLIVVS